MSKKIAYLGVFGASAILLGYVETLIPVFVTVPGMKLGLANLATMVVFCRYGFREAFVVQIVRILVVGFLFGNLFAIAFSLAGGLFSLSVMGGLHRTGGFGGVGMSVAGGVSHNLAQLAAAALIVENFHVFYYLPPLLVSGVVTGILIGILSVETQRRLPDQG